MTILQGNSRSIAQKSGEIWTVQANLQPISFKSDRLLGKAAILVALVIAVMAAFKAGAAEMTVAVTPAKITKPRLVDLGAGKCIPCKQMAPILEKLRDEYAGKFEVVFINVWKAPEAANPYRIRVIPTQIFYDVDGKELFRHEGFYSREQILGKWRELGFAFAEAGRAR